MHDATDHKRELLEEKRQEEEAELGKKETGAGRGSGGGKKETGVGNEIKQGREKQEGCRERKGEGEEAEEVK